MEQNRPKFDEKSRDTPLLYGEVPVSFDKSVKVGKGKFILVTI
jgi:hypothetical protein